MLGKMSRADYRTINFPMLLKVTGWLLMVEAGFMLIPMCVCFAYGESDWLAFAIVSVFTAAIGLCMHRIHARDKSMGRREGFFLTASVWVWFSLFGMLPFILCAARFSVSDAFFEAMSGFTTTGASVLDAHTHLSHGINMWRALMQWLGGMGIILFTLAVLPMLNTSGGMQMFNAEVTGIVHDKVRPRISSTAKTLWGTYFVLTAVLIALLWIGPMDWFDAICYAFSSISTGGYSTSQTALAAFNSDYIYVVLIVFMFLGGVNFSLMFKAASGRPWALWRNEVFRTYVIAVLAFFAIFDMVILVRGGAALTWQSLTIYPLFQVVTTITSTGLDSGHFVWWTPLLVALTMLLMFMGACAGSTSGGAKLDRMMFLLKNLHNEVRRCVRPNSVYSVRIDDKVKSASLVDKVTAFMCIYVLLIFVGGVALTVLDIPLIDAFFSSFSCVSNTGLSASVTGYGTTYEIIPDLGKWILSLLMLIGRLELFTVLILFTRSFWRK